MPLADCLRGFSFSYWCILTLNKSFKYAVNLVAFWPYQLLGKYWKVLESVFQKCQACEPLLK